MHGRSGAGMNNLNKGEDGMSKDSITLDGITYIKQGSEEPKNSNIKIVVLQRGWVMIGRWSQEGDVCSLGNAYVIRTWGTTKGIGELALEGKQSSTKLDKAGHVEFHILTVVAIVNCKENKWDKELI
jgi:hypothetical protein